MGCGDGHAALRKAAKLDHVFARDVKFRILHPRVGQLRFCGSVSFLGGAAGTALLPGSAAPLDFLAVPVHQLFRHTALAVCGLAVAVAVTGSATKYLTKQPFSRTRMASHSITVSSRCAMDTTVVSGTQTREALHTHTVLPQQARTYLADVWQWRA